MSDALIPAGTRIGHVHLKVADLERDVPVAEVVDHLVAVCAS